MKDILSKVSKAFGHVAGCSLAIVKPFYKAFVIRNMWNWFLAGAVHSEDISYVQAFGITMLFYLFANNASDTIEENKRWELLRSYVAEIVPTSAKDRIDSEHKKQENAVWYLHLDSFSDVFTSTIVLAVGWAIHTFLT